MLSESTRPFESGVKKGFRLLSKRYIISLMAANRVGILAALTTALAELGGDLQEVSQTVMQKFFTIILAAEFPDHRDPRVIVEHIRGVCSPYGVEALSEGILPAGAHCKSATRRSKSTS